MTRIFDAGFAAHLASGVTTLCACWRVTRADGAVFGFTDHDRALVFDGTTFDPETGAEGSAVANSADLSVDNAAIEGALSSDRLSPEELVSGRFDGALIEYWRVNWANTAERALLKRGRIGEVKREGARFTAEWRGPAQALDATRGRVFQKGCDAILGDARCGVALAALAVESAVVAVHGEARFSVNGLSPYDPGRFDGGRLDWIAGANAGTRADARRVAGNEIALAVPPGFPIMTGDAFRLHPGCDKSFATCKAKFANAANFRGFPFMPGDDAAIAYPLRGEPLDGGKRR
jgi:uncharacterized phage protein (TIGR02218 family)